VRYREEEEKEKKKKKEKKEKSEKIGEGSQAFSITPGLIRWQYLGVSIVLLVSLKGLFSL